MNRYSTITLEIEAEFSLTDANDIWVTFEQGKKKITKKLSAGAVRVEFMSCFVTLSPRETASFLAHQPIAVQARWLIDDVSDSSTIDYFSLGDVLEEGEL